MKLPELPEPDKWTQRAIRTAELWGEGKMIGGDEDDVIRRLLAEVNRLRQYGEQCYLAGVEATAARVDDVLTAVGMGRADREYVAERLSAIRKGTTA